MTARSRHDELRARAEDVQRQYDGGAWQAPPAHLVAAWPHEVLGLLGELAAAEDNLLPTPSNAELLHLADARAEKLEQALRVLAQFEKITTPCDDGACWECRSAKIARASLAAAAGDSGIEGRHPEGEGR